MSIDNEALLVKRLELLNYSQYQFNYSSSGLLVSRLLSDLTCTSNLHNETNHTTILTLIAGLEAAKEFKSLLDTSEQSAFILKEKVGIL